ncbi:restriction endonuclease subunit S [Frankia sp. AgPm24]|uniref:restriction endonuclease subunit S n=1 Tax=Frankia sp. AgPm24 TaxID=631128 RepID=UPI00200F6BDF|nr:restriction endonuclease subunit S [Frankia sp. AgPm24]MCK9923217.1 restriction endonuclease subunit S [Frankia sp. AgPm24]
MDSLIGTIPDTWQATSLGAVCQVQAGPSRAAFGTAGSADTGLWMITPTCIQDGQLRDHGRIALSPERAKSICNHRLRTDDIVLTRIGESRRHALVDATRCGYYLGGACILLRPHPPGWPDEGPSVDARYLNHYLRLARVQHWMADEVGGVAVPVMSATRLQTLPLVLPPTSVQQDVASALDAFDAKIAAHQRILEATAELRDALAPALFTGAIPTPTTTGHPPRPT